MLEVKSISIDIDEVRLINALSFTLEPSQILHIKGKNGAGKTTLLRALLGLFPIKEGAIVFNTPYDHSIGYIGHKHAIEPLLTLEENIQASLLGEETVIDLAPALKMLKLYEHKDNLGDQLSEGQRKKVSLARFIMLKKSLWLLDEPFTALDVDYQRQLKNHMSTFVQGGGSILLTSHQPLEIEKINYRELVL